MIVVIFWRTSKSKPIEIVQFGKGASHLQMLLWFEAQKQAESTILMVYNEMKVDEE